MAIKKILISGNEAIALGAIHAGCGFYAGYPITPQNELIAYMARHLPQAGGVFLQAESELAAINMVFGAAATGTRAMTSSSSPGISLMQEGISYIAAAELPAVIANIMRAGPGLGDITPSQSDYFQATKGGGHGDYHCLVLAPSSAQEAYAFPKACFALAERYRNPVIILGDGLLGQMMEPIRLPSRLRAGKPKAKSCPWALTGCQGRKPNIIRSLYIKQGVCENKNLDLQKKYKLIQANEQHWEGESLESAQIILVAYGSMARIVRSVKDKLNKKGDKIGFIRPISLWPFPSNAFRGLKTKNKRLVILVVEMSYGQMVDDVRLAVGGKIPVEFIGRAGGGIPTEEEIISKINRLAR